MTQKQKTKRVKAWVFVDDEENLEYVCPYTTKSEALYSAEEWFMKDEMEKLKVRQATITYKIPKKKKR